MLEVLALVALGGMVIVGALGASALRHHRSKASATRNVNRDVALAMLRALHHLHSAVLRYGWGSGIAVQWRRIRSLRSELSGNELFDFTLFDDYVEAIASAESSPRSLAEPRLLASHNRFIPDTGTAGPAGLLEAAMGRRFEEQWHTATSQLYVYHVTSTLFLRRIQRDGLSVGRMSPIIARAISQASHIYERCGVHTTGRMDVVLDTGCHPVFCRETSALIESAHGALRGAAADGLPAFAFELLNEDKVLSRTWGRRPTEEEARVLRWCWHAGAMIRRRSRMAALRIRVSSELLRREGAADVTTDRDAYRKLIFVPHVNDLLVAESYLPLAVSVPMPDAGKIVVGVFRTISKFAFDIPLHRPVPPHEIEVLLLPKDSGQRAAWTPLVEILSAAEVATL